MVKSWSKDGRKNLLSRFDQLYRRFRVRSGFRLDSLSRPKVGGVAQWWNVGLWPANVLCPALELYSWRVTTYVGKPSARLTNQANSAFHPFRVDKWVVSCYWMYAASVRGDAIWLTFTKERQAWCNLQVKLCDPCLSAMRKLLVL